MSRLVSASHNQDAMFTIDDKGNVTYFVNGEPQDYNQLLDSTLDFEDFNADDVEQDLQLSGYTNLISVEQDITAIEKEDDKTVLLSISDLEKIRKILIAIPQFRDLAVARGQDVESIEFLAQVVKEVDFMSLPHFEVDMSIFNILTKDNPDYREFVFSNVLNLINKVSTTNKFPSRRYLQKLFIDFNQSDIENIYALIKKLLSVLNAWGGMQVHLFEQTVRDWMYLVYEEGCELDEAEIVQYLVKTYPCMPTFQVNYISQLLFSAQHNSATINQFIEQFVNFLSYFVPEENIFLKQAEVYRLWNSDFLKNRIEKVADKWRSRISQYKILDPSNDLDAFFGVRKRLSKRIKEGVLPNEVFASDSLNEILIKYKLYFSEGHRAYIEARIDRFVRVDGRVGIFDWKTKKKNIDELNDFEKLQIILQCIAVQNLASSTNEGGTYHPMGDDDYKFFYTQVSTEWLNVDHLPEFSHIPEATDELFEYVRLHIDSFEVKRLLDGFSSIVNFLICNKKPIAKVRRFLKAIDSYIPAPKLVDPVNSDFRLTGTEG